MKISVCGKGGSGKSALTSLLANQAISRGLGVLVVDSDESNSGLFKMLGFENPPVPLMELVGGKKKLKEKMAHPNVLAKGHLSIKDIPSRHLIRRNGLMLISIGKILQALEGCACPMGVLNREFLKKLRLGEKEIAIIDMEAGVEHFGRGIDEGIDRILLVVEPSFESLTVAEKIKGLASGLDREVLAVLNKIDSERIALKLEGELRTRDIEVIGIIPNDPLVFEACLEGRTLGGGEAFNAAGKVLGNLLSENRDMD
ncbi:MAG: ATP-binding protein [Deltaproteobacteria bacterium]|nr:ATP-binding protein [Deltaproteobacteria bacterium]MBW2112616.1 ATP-binding protein [Deltaproteobacteria bacterium]MBW2353936.1 ATP-binding protein [Deltaproteobacteria bacterium]HDZ24389.1 ATP-binding protein [Desulfobacteraceae bacterium]